MTAIILGASGRLGGVLRRANERASGPWLTQSRGGDADIAWDGRFDALPDGLFQTGGTLINMIGAVGPDEGQLTAINVDFTVQLLRAAYAAGVRHVILASSAAVYGAGHGDPFVETDPMRPVNAYGDSKARMEDAVHGMASDLAGMAVTILRIANVAGSDALLASARAHVVRQQPVPLHCFGDGTPPVRSYIGPADLYAEVKQLVDHPPTGIETVNVTGPEPVDLRQMLDGYRTHLLPTLTWVEHPAPAGVPSRVVLSADKLQRLVPLPTVANPADDMARQVAEDRPDETRL